MAHVVVPVYPGMLQTSPNFALKMTLHLNPMLNCGHISMWYNIANEKYQQAFNAKFPSNYYIIVFLTIIVYHY